MIAITGSTGALGGGVASRLAERGVRQRLIVREVARAPQLVGADAVVAAGYHDTAAMTAALRGVDTLFFVSGRESATRLTEHASVVEAAVTARVRRIVYVSIFGAAPDSTFTLAADHYATEQLIRKSGLAFTFLQDNFYLDFAPSLASAGGVIAGPGGDGRVACVARDDVAEVAALVLGPGDHDGRTYRLTGPEAFTLAELALQLSRFSGRLVTYTVESLAQAYASRASYGAPKFEVDAWVTTYLAIAKGEFATVSGDVPNLLGRPAMALSEFLTKHPESYKHLAA